jgi:CRISPR/Cas system-associated exonuclease Cas4 (RecB family)
MPALAFFILSAHGRPDYILKNRETFIPVKRKSRIRKGGPDHREVLQLAECCLLVEDRHQTTVLTGRLQYLNGSIDIPFDEALRLKLFRTLEAIGRLLSARCHTATRALLNAGHVNFGPRAITRSAA